ncbi:protein ANTAGONIST OF LIKE HETEROCHROMATIN PROTEIN 1-like [Xenia sp. Carnegie-2017]|uniref:protein ANTAGONIST OF LIKE HETEROCHROMATIN PROTEIN 1-like n=1 Tax=Xenia sp. Carnegie-2017 TaxID=2897299 RepID=UPI001F04E849|nr:protein ANTAGONIST OF LIKE HETEROCHROMATIN PROTEIN 1-like [Xenia sp. Carnegie-2017]
MVDAFKKRKLAAAFAIFISLDEQEKKPTRGRTRRWIKRRGEIGYFNTIVRELMMEDTASYCEMMRMSYKDFKYILQEIASLITPQRINGGQRVISPAERLTLTLRFLATCETFRSMSFQFRVCVAAISYIIKEVCKAKIKHLGPKFFKVPSTNEQWLEIASKFEERWNYPNCIGAIDGKHIVMQPPASVGSYYYNYKHTHSIVLMAIAGPDYECIYADVRTNGRVSMVESGKVWTFQGNRRWCSVSSSTKVVTFRDG